MSTITNVNVVELLMSLILILTVDLHVGCVCIRLSVCAWFFLKAFFQSKKDLNYSGSAYHLFKCMTLFESKVSNDHELLQSEPYFCHRNQNINQNYK